MIPLVTQMMQKLKKVTKWADIGKWRNRYPPRAIPVIRTPVSPFGFVYGRVISSIVVDAVVDVELTSRRFEPFDAGFLFQRLGVIDNDLAFAPVLLATTYPDRYPELATVIVKLGMNGEAKFLICNLDRFDDLASFLVQNLDCLLNFRVRVLGLVKDHVVGVRMSPDK